MKLRNRMKKLGGQTAVAVLLLTLGPGLELLGRADEKTRAPAGTCTTATATILRREKPQAKWQIVKEKETLHSGDMLLGLPGARLTSKDGAVEVRLMADLFSPLPVLEPAVVLHDSSSHDLDLKLDRGRIDLINLKKKGEARVRVEVQGTPFELTLNEPQARIVLEMCGCWPAGVPFTRTPGPKDKPFAQLLFLVTRGTVDLKHGGSQFALHAPPGPAQMMWDNVSGLDSTPERVDKVPGWAGPNRDPAQQAKLEKIQEMVRKLSEEAASKPLDTVIDGFLQSDDPAYRRAAVIVLGAMDDLQGLSRVLSETKHPDVWDNAILVFRHWIGRGPGQDQVLYKALVETRHYTPVQAETVLQFLHSFSDADKARPELYEMLIDYLDNEKLGIRGLAHWHLIRLVPAGKKIPYDPLAPKEERQKAREQWKQLVPAGKLPPKEKGK
jgi:hypothetical protein